jgi:hypothetical protein
VTADHVYEAYGVWFSLWVAYSRRFSSLGLYLLWSAETTELDVTVPNQKV